MFHVKPEWTLAETLAAAERQVEDEEAAALSRLALAKQKALQQIRAATAPHMAYAAYLGWRSDLDHLTAGGGP